MSRTTKLVLIGLSAIAVLWPAYWLWTGGPPLTPNSGNLQAPAITVEKARLVKHQANRKLWELEADSIETRESTSIATDVTLRFFDQDGREALTVRAPQTRLEHSTGNLALSGAIQAVGSEFSFSTENLRWDAQKKLLYTDAAIRVEREDFSLSGRGFEYSTETGLATVKSEAHLVWRSTPK